MELRDFAEQVLFATSLDAKLQAPGDITDERPGPAIVAPPAPGRPPDLQFRSESGGRADFPGLHRLEQERERGRLLHFFANHELLATELMALVLLRFPEAPAAFRRGVFLTLQDEQEHTRLYMERMRTCGIAFGELPVSGWFWRCLAPMENPIDYVAGLCLTFEQANLDFARHFARGFGQVGDAPTAALLERIYHDEIGHVAYGLKWFRRWKNPDESDWQAFCRTLKFPLSPQRAKGFTLNVEGRLAAGFKPEFIAELDVYAQSKGRTPSVFVFNPFAEEHIAQGRAFTPVKHQAQLERDLANLPQFLGRQDDIVLVPERPATAFLSGIKQAGFALPEFIECPEGRVDPDAAGLASRKLGRLRPWAWGPDSMELLEPLFGLVTGEERTAAQRFHAGIAALYSKAWSAGLLREILAAPGIDDAARLLCTGHEVGSAVTSVEQALEVIADMRGRGHHRIVVKQALGLAGHNSIRLWEPEILEPQRRWMEHALGQGRELVVELWLEREVDFSVQLEMEPTGLKLCGYTGLLNDRKGQYQANWADPDFTRRLPINAPTLFPEVRDAAGRLRSLYAMIVRRLEPKLREVDYQGPIGIDAFVFRMPAGECRLKPVVEINPRYTMGRLTLELMKRAAPGRSGCLRLVNRTAARAAGFDDFAAFARSLRERHPLRWEGEPVPRILEGALCLNDPARAQAMLAFFRVGPTVAEVQSTSCTS